MRKRFLSVLTAAAVAGTMITAVPIYAADVADGSTLLFSDDFTDASELSGYTTYDGTDASTWSASNGYIEAKYSADWSATNGIKKDITSYVAGHSGETFSASVDFHTWGYYSNDAVLGFDVVSADGTTTTVILDKKIGTDSSFTTFSGSAQLTFEASDTVYLRMTHHTGNHRYDNISLVLGEYQAEEPTPTEEATKTELFGTDIYKDGAFSIYDETNESATITYWENFGLQATFGNDWGNENGVKTDITDYVKGYSGKTFSLSAAVTTWAWNGNNDTINKAKAFFKVVSQDGSENIVEICSGPDSTDDISENEATISGSAELTFEDTDRVYLCFKHGAGQQQYKAISFSVIDEPAAEEPTPTATTDNTAKTVIFAPSDLSGYSEFIVNNEETGTVTPHDGYASFEQAEGYGWNTENGVKINVTDYLKSASSGDTFEASFTFRSYYWGGTNVSAYFETESGRKVELETTTEVGEDGTDQNVVARGAFTYSDDDVVYLHILHPSGNQTYSYFKLSYVDDSAVVTEPTPTATAEADDTPKTVIFAPSDINGYSEFTVNNEETGTVTPHDGYASFEQADGHGWDTENGVKINVTDYLKSASSGDTFEASFTFRSYYWGGTNINAYFETESGRTAGLKTITEVGENGTDQKVVVRGAFAYSDDDVVYLHILHPSGNQTYSYFTLSYSEASASPTMQPGIGGVEVYAPELTESGAKTVISNKSNDDAEIKIYTAKYNDGVLASVKIKDAVIPANTLNNEVEIEAEAGDTVYVWNDKQEALLDKTVVEEQAMLGSWSAAQQEFFQSNIDSVTGSLSNTTIRQKVHLSKGGDKLTIELSNQFGAGPLEITAAHAALPADGSAIKPETDTAITFDGISSVIIPAGKTVVSDPVYISTEDLSDLFVTISVGDVPYKSTISTYSTGLTGHAYSRATSYVKSGSDVTVEDMSSASKMSAWVFLAAVDVLAPVDNEAIVCFGDSITDGVGSTENANNRWTDVLAGLCNGNDDTKNISVLNMGIAGNAIVSGSVGPMATSRFEKDVLDKNGVKYVVLLEGINDIGKESALTADPSYSVQIINAYKDFIEKAHEKGIKVYGGTILPCGNYTTYYSEYEEQLRDEINTWIKSDESGFDGVIDFASALEDSEKPGYLNKTYDCGDGLHPSVAGYELMGTMVYNTVFGK